MAKTRVDPFTLSADQLCALLSINKPLFPELEAARANPAAMLSSPAVREALALSKDALQGIEIIPQTPYTPSTLFQLTGDRREYETPYFLKRKRLHAAALRLFLGQSELRNIVQDYIWSICEETTWVLPAHMARAIDLFSSETAFNLAELLVMLGDVLDGEMRARVRREIERRIFEPYLLWHTTFGWYKGSNNWNGVCNSSVMSTFLILDPERRRVAKALQIALAGLQAFLETAFEADGTSTEGVGYWNYGLLNFIPLSEMLRSTTGGVIDLLAVDKIKKIAAFPARVMLSPGYYACFSDAEEENEFNPGNIARLQERTGERSLSDLLIAPRRDSDWRLTVMLRNALWWDGVRPSTYTLNDAYLPMGGIARLAAATPAGVAVVAAIKAGHNGQPHNQNDVGSIVVHVDGETLLTDPGRGLYTRQYFGPDRYANVFCSSYGHSVPRIGGTVQAAGQEYRGEMAVSAKGKQAVVEMARAYPVPGLAGLRRQLMLKDGVVTLHDDVAFSGAPLPVEEAFITWCEVEAKGATARVIGQKHTLKLIIEAPAGVRFALERLEKESKENRKTEVLKRLSFVLPAGAKVQARVRMEVE